MKDNDNDDVWRLIAKSAGKLKEHGGGKLPGDALHICTTHPVMNCANVQAVCAGCGCAVYYSDQSQPHLQKVCPACALKQAPGEVENIITPETVKILAQAADLFGRRN